MIAATIPTIAMAKIAMVKNTGPDLDKIVDTIEHFGPGYTYLVAAYPPFLKDLRDRLDAEGCARYVVTDVTKDGTLRGPNLDLLREITSRTPKPRYTSSLLRPPRL